MIASPEERFPHHVVKNHDDKEDIGLLRTSVIYGANASGKSNLAKAMKFAKKFIVNGKSKNKNITPQAFKLDQAYLGKSTRMEFEFKCEGKQYAYGFIINKTTVLEEWLFEIGIHKENAIFERQKQIINFNFSVSLLEKVSEGEKQRLNYEAQGTRSNLLFLTNTKEREIHHFIDIYNWFDNTLTIIFPDTRPSLLPFFFPEEKEELSKKLCKQLQFFDFDIQNVGAKDVELSKSSAIPEAIKSDINDNFPHDEEDEMLFLPQFNTLVFKENNTLFTKELFLYKNDVLFEIKEESNGTQRIIDLIPMLLQLSNKECVFFVDEIENSLHTLLIRKIFDYILNNSEMKGKPSQLIATTHEVLLLDTHNLFRKDEIWFVEKDKQGASQFYSLANADVDDLDLAKGYLKGRFGAIPLFKNIINEES